MTNIEFLPHIFDERDFDRQYFFDTNVWIFIQGPFVNIYDYRTENYSGLLKRILDDGGQVYTDPVVVCEFVKVFIALQHKALVGDGEAPENFKEFRQTEAYRKLVRDVADDLFHLLNSCKTLGIEFDKNKYDEICTGLSDGSLDFPDGLIVETCKKEDLILVTDDFDFVDCDVHLISANPRYNN